jgi:hypothetical protein
MITIIDLRSHPLKIERRKWLRISKRRDMAVKESGHSTLKREMEHYRHHQRSWQRKSEKGGDNRRSYDLLSFWNYCFDRVRYIKVFIKNTKDSKVFSNCEILKA